MTDTPLVVLGATGSIGTQTLAVARRSGMQVAGLAARSPSESLADLASSWPEAMIVVTGGAPSHCGEFADRVGGGRVEFGHDAMVELARTPATVVNGVVGVAGLGPTVAALEAGNRVALANKESLVAGGSVVLDAARRGAGELIPVDSEHSAIFQLLDTTPRHHLESLLLTASGGPFRGWSAGDLADVTPAQALKHPTWDMGRRISIDSATLANKGLEVIEASLLFDVPIDDVEVVVHPQSVVHSMIRLTDGSVLAHIGETDMRHPIEYAITHPGRARHPESAFVFAGLSLTFEEPDLESFPALGLAYEAGRAGGTMPAVFNAADEIAVEAFLQGRLGFLGISEVIGRTMESATASLPGSVDDVIAADREARGVAASLIAGAC